MPHAFLLIGLIAGASPASAEPPAAWSCGEEAWGDALCDCGCGAYDAACVAKGGDETFAMCDVDACGVGRVPWEHEPSKCMSSACGDGWTDVDAGEVCDDGNALASGGCAADCGAVQEGWICGEMAEGCWRDESADQTTDAPIDTDTPDDDPAPTGGCDQGTGGLLWAWPVALLLLRGRRAVA